jgi:hypothetical protein
MQIVLGAVLGGRELIAAGDRAELARRRNITIKPGQGARAILAERAPASVPAPEPGPDSSAAVPVAT